MSFHTKYKAIPIAAILLLCCAGVKAQNASPLGGVGNLQFFDNSGSPLISGVVYIYNGGTSTQATVYVDATGTTTQPNPVTFGSGARASIWLANSTFVKVVLCSQNDGPFCAAGDILFSADQVPIGSSGGGGGGGSPFTGIFISSTASPATSGVLRVASGDSAVCFRNASGSTNLCFKKDSNDLLSWDGGSLKLPEVGAPAGVASFDILWADSTAHRLKAVNNGGTAAQYVLSGNDIDTTDAVKDLHFGSSQAPIGSTLPSTNQFLQWNGSQIVGTVASVPTNTSFPSAPSIVYSTASASTNASIAAVTMATAGGGGNTYRFSYYVDETVAGVGCSTNTTVQVLGIWTDPSASSTTSNGNTFTITNNGALGNNSYTGAGLVGSLGATFRAKASTVVQYSVTYVGGTCTTTPSYQVYPILEQLQ